MLARNNCKFLIMLSLLAFLLTGGNAWADAKATYTDGFYLSVLGGENSVYIEGTRGDVDDETLEIQVMMRLDNTAAVEDTVGIIHAYFTYDNTKLTLDDAYANPTAWPWDFECTTLGYDNGVVQLSFTAGFKEASYFYNIYKAIATVKFKAKCGPSYVNTPLEFPEYDLNNPNRNSMTTRTLDEYRADEADEMIGKSILIDYYVYGLWPAAGSYPGALGTEIIVPILFYNDSYVDGIDFTMVYDTLKLHFIELVDVSTYFPAGCEGGCPDEGDYPVIAQLRTGDSYDIPSGMSEDPVVWAKFYCRYDNSFWDGASAYIGVTQFSVRVGQNTTGYCAAAASGAFYYPYGHNITIPAYAASFITSSKGRIFKDEPAAFCTTTVSMSNNFPIGLGTEGSTSADDSKIRIDFTFSEAMDIELDYLYHPSLGSPNYSERLDDFWFEAHTGTAKTIDTNYEFYSIVKSELLNYRDHVPDTVYQDVLKFGMEFGGGWTAPTSYALRYFTFPFSCDFDSRNARLLDTTGLRSVECGTGLDVSTDAVVEYAVGKFYAPAVITTEPANPTQHYYLYANFVADTFSVAINRSGPHYFHTITPLNGAVVDTVTSTQVVLIAGAEWEAADASNGIQIASITYSRYYYPPIIEDPLQKSGDGEKDSGPGTQWCYRTTTITFGQDSFIKDAQNREPWMFNAAGTVKTRYNCGHVPVDPLPNPLEPFKQASLPTEFRLNANYPNPFNPATTVSFELPQASPVRIEIFNVLGQKVRTLIDGYKEAGRHDIQWNGTDAAGHQVSSGIYFCRMTAGEYNHTIKMMMMK